MRRITCAAARLSAACLLTAMLLAGCASIGELVSRPPPESQAQPLLPAEQQTQALSARARAQEADGDAYGAAQTRVQLAPSLSGAQRARNAQKIQALLASLGAEPLKGRYDALDDNDPLKPFAHDALEQLGVALPRVLPQLDHPVGTVTGEGAATQREGFRMPAQVALLLPTHGALATAGEAVREGFVTAYFDAAHADTPRPQVRTYDSGSTPTQAQSAYQKAVADGAALVIGPLGRDAVAAMFAQPALPVPLLALNHPDNNAQPPPGSAEFGLLPEVEGAQAAAHLNERGIHHTIVFLVNDDRARRAASAFKAQFESLGGQVLNQTALATSSVDYAADIKIAMANAGDDAGILILMRPQTARLLLPQLKLAGVKQPVFATSLVYGGSDSPTADRDLDGIEFCDAPWLFDAQPSLPNHAAIASKLPAARGAAARLFAFGMDAYALMPYLDWLRAHPGTYLPGATGQLTQDDQGHVHRTPVWARFDNGVARPVAAGLDSESPEAGAPPSATPSP